MKTLAEVITDISESYISSCFVDSYDNRLDWNKDLKNPINSFNTDYLIIRAVCHTVAKIYGVDSEMVYCMAQTEYVRYMNNTEYRNDPTMPMGPNGNTLIDP